jgi:hypothetical protein
VVTEYHAIDRTSPEWRELVTAGNRARLQWVNSGNSGLVSEERKAARWMRRKEKRIQKLYGKHVSPPLVRRLTLIAKADREALEKTKREKKERAATLKRVSEDSGVRELLRATPALWEMRDHFTVLSASKPVVLQYTTSPKVDTPDKAAPPPACITQAQQDRTVFDEQLEKFCRDHVIWDVKAPLPKTQTVWCEVLCRCICGTNVHFLWAHSSLRTFWNRHLKKKEVDAGRLVFEVVSYPTPLPGPRRIYLTSAKIADRVCFWQVEQVGERSTGAETRMLVRTMHKADGEPELLSRWDIVFQLMDWNKETGKALSGRVSNYHTLSGIRVGLCRTFLSCYPPFLLETHLLL